MATFGDELRALRNRHGLTQEALAALIGYQLSRATIANVESGNQAASPRLMQVLSQSFPKDMPRLQTVYEDERREREERQGLRVQGSVSPPRPADDETSQILGASVVMESYNIIYVFKESQAPEEIIELRRVRATRNGTHDYGLHLAQENSDRFEVEPEVLFGGELVDSRRVAAGGKTHYERRLEFSERLRRGQVHEFGLRYWVERDPEPDNCVNVRMTLRTEAVGLHLNFWGDQVPAQVWRYGPVRDSHLMPGGPLDPDDRLGVVVGRVSASFVQPEVGTEFGIAWRWG